MIDAKLNKLLEACVTKSASDLHLSVNAPPYFRIHGRLRAEAQVAPLNRETLETMVGSLMNSAQRDHFQKFNALDLAYALPSGRRFRINLFQERHGVAVAARLLDEKIRTFTELELPRQLEKFSDLIDGLVLFTGPTGSGKSTSLAAILDRINRTQERHILTIEDPIEYLHTNQLSLVRQRELHNDVDTFANAVRSALREDPDVVLVGEMRDIETMRTAITLAETGHLVFSTLHTGSAVGALDRLVGAFPANERDGLCQQLSMTLRAVVAQRLLPRQDTPGRVPAAEILMVTSAVANLIRNYKPQQIYSAMESGTAHGMQTMEHCLANMYLERKISLEEL